MNFVADKIRGAFASPAKKSTTEMSSHNDTANEEAPLPPLPPAPSAFQVHDPLAPVAAADVMPALPPIVGGAGDEMGWPEPPQPGSVTAPDTTKASQPLLPIINAPPAGDAAPAVTTDPKPLADNTKKEAAPAAGVDNYSDTDSITGEINPKKKSPSPETVPDKPSIHNGEPALGSNTHQEPAAAPKGSDGSNDLPNAEPNQPEAKKDESYLEDSDDGEGSSLLPKAAIKKPRNSAAAEAYAKRVGTSTSPPAAASEGMAAMDMDQLAACCSGKEAQGGEGSGSDGENSKGHVKTKRTSKVPKDGPPNLKSPPEEMEEEEDFILVEDEPFKKKSTPARKPRAAKATPRQGTRRSSRNSATKPEEVISSPDKADPKSPGNSKRKRGASEVEEEVAEATSPAVEESPGGSRRSKRARKPSLLSTEKLKNEEAAEALASPHGIAIATRAGAPMDIQTAATRAGVRKGKVVPKKKANVPKKLKAIVKNAPKPPKKEVKKEGKGEELFDVEFEGGAEEGDVDAWIPEENATKPLPKSKKAKKPKTPTVKKERSAEYTTRLEERKAATWNDRIVMLLAHKETFGSCDLTEAPKDEVPSLLRSFVLESRKQYKKYKRGEHSTLNAARIVELEGYGFDFAPLESGKTRGNHDRRFQRQWDGQFAELERYKAEHGDTLVSCVTSGNYVKLGNWVRGQRKLYNKVGREGFPAGRIAKLDAIGFDFDPMKSGSFIVKKRANMFPRVDANWNKHFTNLAKYKEEKGNIIIGPNTEGWPGLYDWIHCQRKEYKKFEAGDEKALMYECWVKKMNELGFDWAPMKGDGFSKMLLQRQSKHFNDIWMKHYNDLKVFHKKHGHCYVSRCGDEEALASWIHVQRKHKRKHEAGKGTPLSDERLRLLDEVGLDWAPSKSGGMQRMTQANRDRDWEGVFARLVTFKNRTGHANPKKAEPKLGPWACRMRKLYAQNASGEATTLTDDKIAKLEGVGFRFVNTQQQASDPDPNPNTQLQQQASHPDPNPNIQQQQQASDPDPNTQQQQQALDPTPVDPTTMASV